MSKEVKQSQVKKKVKQISDNSTEEEILKQILHVMIGKQQLIEAECSLRNEEYDKIVLYMGQAIQSLEVLELNQMFREKRNIAVNNSLLQDTQIQDKMDIKMTRRFETYMTEIQKKMQKVKQIIKFESYEQVIKKCFEQVEQLLQEIESKQILTSLLNLQIQIQVNNNLMKIDEPKIEMKEDDKKQKDKNQNEVKSQGSRRNNDKEEKKKSSNEEKKVKEEAEQKEDPYLHLKKNINKELEKLCKIEEEYYQKYEITNDIKENFTPFNNDDLRLDYWRKRVGIDL